MYVQRDDHATGLIRLLSIALRVLTLMEFVVRRRLAAEGATLAGLYAGNAKRETARPTAERLLEAFQEVTLMVVEGGHQVYRHLTALSPLQERILELLGFSSRAYRRTSKSSAAGIDGVTAKQYAEHLDENLQDLHGRLRSGRYQAAPVVRVWIEKEDGGRRPIDKPAFEDKIVQRAVAMLLEAIYEQDFSDCSYGFRPGRSPHHALRDLRTHCMEEGIGWIVDADVSGYFDPAS
jgi:hypothetical protein